MKTQAELESMDVGALVLERQEVLGEYRRVAEHIKMIDHLIFKGDPPGGAHALPDAPVPPELSESDVMTPTRFPEAQLDSLRDQLADDDDNPK